MKYLKKKSKKFKDFTTRELTELVGNDMNIMEKIFKDNKESYSKKDVEKVIGKYNIDLQLKNLDKCHIIFLKNMLIEYYKVNHKTENIKLENLVHQSYKCDEAFHINTILKNLRKNKIVKKGKTTVRFYSAVVKNALIKYFKDYK